MWLRSGCDALTRNKPLLWLLRHSEPQLPCFFEENTALALPTIAAPGCLSGASNSTRLPESSPCLLPCRACRCRPAAVLSSDRPAAVSCWCHAAVKRATNLPQGNHACGAPSCLHSRLHVPGQCTIHALVVEVRGRCWWSEGLAALITVTVQMQAHIGITPGWTLSVAHVRFAWRRLPPLMI